MTGMEWRFEKILIWVGSDPDRISAQALRDAVHGFVHEATRYDVLTDEDVPAEALLSVSLSAYDSQVCNGGHWQFAVNTRMNPVLLERVERCLNAVGVDEHIAIFGEFRALMAASASELPPVEMLDDLEMRPPGIDLLDRRFFKARERTSLWDAHFAWLRGSGSLRFATHWQEPELAIAAAIEAHPAYQARRNEIEAQKAAEAKAAEERNRHRRNRAVRFLCEAAGLEVRGLHAALPEEVPGVRIIPVETTSGRHFVRFEGPTATLMTEALRPTGFSSNWFFNELHKESVSARIGRIVRRFTT